MNREEWTSTYAYSNNKYNKHYKYVQQLLKDWKVENNITESCVAHHRDDNDEVKSYNNAFYERWGCNEDGTFELGKYVQFMTRVEHAHYHNAGGKSPRCGKSHTEETKRKISAANTGKHASEDARRKMSESRKGKTFSDEHKKKLSIALSGENNPMFGKTVSDETREKLSAAHKGRTFSDEHKKKISIALKGKIVSDETREKLRQSRPDVNGENNPMFGKHHSIETKEKIKEKIKEKAKVFSMLYNVYKNNNGAKSCNEFKHAVKTGDITFEMQPISVFINQ